MQFVLEQGRVVAGMHRMVMQPGERRYKSKAAMEPVKGINGHV